MMSQREDERTSEVGSEIDLAALLHGATQRQSHARRATYDVFGNYRISKYGTPEGACAHCITEEQFQDLCSTPLAKLSLEQVYRYCTAVWPKISDFKYFLPRLLELTNPGADAADWEALSRKFPATGWAVCSEVELHTVARYLTASDEHARLARASETADSALLLLPFTIPSPVEVGLPLAAALDRNLSEQRRRLFENQLERWTQEGTVSAIALLARGTNALLDEQQTRKLLKRRELSIVPSDDAFFHWIISGAAEATLSQALERPNVPDDAALQLAMAFAHVVQIAPR